MKNPLSLLARSYFGRSSAGTNGNTNESTGAPSPIPHHEEGSGTLMQHGEMPSLFPVPSSSNTSSSSMMHTPSDHSGSETTLPGTTAGTTPHNTTGSAAAAASPTTQHHHPLHRLLAAPAAWIKSPVATAPSAAPPVSPLPALARHLRSLSPTSTQAAPAPTPTTVSSPQLQATSPDTTASAPAPSSGRKSKLVSYLLTVSPHTPTSTRTSGGGSHGSSPKRKSTVRIDFTVALPTELVQRILGYLDAPALLRLAQCSRTCHAVARDNQVWHQLYRRCPQWRGSRLGGPRRVLQNTLAPTQLSALDWRFIFRNRHTLQQNWRRQHPAIQTLHGHLDSVYCIQLDRTHMVSGSRDQTVKVWRLDTLQVQHTLTGHTGSVLCLQFDEGGTLVTGSSDATIMVWDLVQRTRTQVLQSHTAGVLDVVLAPTLLLSCSKDNTIKVWDRVTPHTFTLRCTLAGHRAAVNAIQYARGTLVSASGDYLLKLWHVSAAPGGATTFLRDLEGHTRGIACVAFDGDHILSGSNDRTIKIWNAHTGACLKTLHGHDDLVRTLALDPAGLPGILVSGSYDQTVKIWDWRKGRLLHSFSKLHTSWVFNVACNATHIISASQDQSIVIYDYTAGVDVQWIL